jgi:hypothetical protein
MRLQQKNSDTRSKKGHRIHAHAGHQIFQLEAVQVAHTHSQYIERSGLVFWPRGRYKNGVCRGAPQRVIQLNGGHFHVSDLHSEKWKTALDQQLVILLVLKSCRAQKKCGVGTRQKWIKFTRLLDVLANRSGTKSGAEFLHTLCTARRLIINGMTHLCFVI